MTKRGADGAERLDRAFAAEERDRLVGAAEMEAALDALLGEDDPPANRAALQRAFLLLALHYEEVVPGSFRDAESLTERLTTVLELYRAGELRLPFDRGSLRRDQALAAAAPEMPKLRAMTPEDRWRAVLETPALWTEGSVEVLCGESLREAGLGHAEEAVAWAELAVSAVSGVERLNRLLAESTERIVRPLRAAANGAAAGRNDELAAKQLADLRAFAQAHLANAYRVAGDLRKAEETFESMEPALDSPGGIWWSPEAAWEPLYPYEPVCLALLASLRRAQRRVPEALELLARARRCEHELAPVWTARFAVAQARALQEIDRHQESIRLLLAVDAESDPFLERLRLSNLADCYSLTDNVAQAEKILARLGRGENDYEDLCLEWVRARCCAARGEHEEAVAHFRIVRAAFVSRSSGAYDAALVSLELSLVLAGLGRFDEVVALARQSVGFFTAECIDREALAALMVYQQAAAAGAEGVAAIEAVYRFLRRARGDRSLRFKPSRA